MAIIDAPTRAVDADPMDQVDTAGPNWLTRDRLVDISVIALLTLIGLWGFRSSIGGWSFLLVGAIGLLVGGAIAVVGAVRKISLSTLGLVAIAVSVALAGLVAVRATTIAGVIPTLDTLQAVAQGFTVGWRELSTTPPPTGDLGYVLVIPYLCGFIAGIFGISGALRTKNSWFALVSPILVLGAGIVTGTKEPQSLLLQGSVFGAVIVAWLADRQRRRTTVVVAGTTGRWRAVAAVLMVVGAALAGWIIGPGLPGSTANERFVLSNVLEPEVDLSVFPSPLSGARQSLVVAKNTELFSVDNLPAGERLRLAVMDHWDGDAMAVAGVNSSRSSGSFQRVGSSIPTRVAGASTDVVIRVTGYKGPWVPTVGGVTTVDVQGPNADRATAVRSAYRYNVESDSALIAFGGQAEQLRPGDVLLYSTNVRPIPPDSAAQYGAASALLAQQPDNAEIPDAMSELTAKYQGNATGPYLLASAMAKGLAAEGYYTKHDSLNSDAPGANFARLDKFSGTAPIVGDEEQYGASAALMVRAAGVPVRLVMGYDPAYGNEGQQAAPVAVDGAPVSIYGRNLMVWLEVGLDGVGWVPVADSTTPPRSKLNEQPLTEKPKPKPQVQAPPPPAPDIEVPLVAQGADGEESGDSAGGWFSIPGWLIALLKYVLLPLGLISALVVGILVLKGRRVAKRRADADAGRAVIGGWHEVLDHARDLRIDVPRRGTRAERVAGISELPAGAAERLPRLAFGADAATFAPQPPTADEVSAYWDDVDTATASMYEGLPTWKLWRAKLSIGSLLGDRRLSEVIVAGARGGMSRASRAVGAATAGASSKVKEKVNR